MTMGGAGMITVGKAQGGGAKHVKEKYGKIGDCEESKNLPTILTCTRGAKRGNFVLLR
jgi:hypothetical protein